MDRPGDILDMGFDEFTDRDQWQAVKAYVKQLEARVEQQQDIIEGYKTITPYLNRLQEIGFKMLYEHPEFENMTKGELWDLLTAKLLELLEREGE